MNFRESIESLSVTYVLNRIIEKFSFDSADGKSAVTSDLGARLEFDVVFRSIADASKFDVPVLQSVIKLIHIDTGTMMWSKSAQTESESNLMSNWFCILWKKCNQSDFNRINAKIDNFKFAYELDELFYASKPDREKNLEILRKGADVSGFGNPDEWQEKQREGRKID